MQFRSILLVALASLGQACTTTRDSVPAGTRNVSATRAVAVHGWEVWSENTRLGAVVRFETRDDANRAYFSVRNEHEQEVGLIDAEGRAWRHVPHQRDPEWVATGTVRAGACSILHADPNARLVEVELANLAQHTQH